MFRTLLLLLFVTGCVSVYAQQPEKTRLRRSSEVTHISYTTTNTTIKTYSCSRLTYSSAGYPLSVTDYVPTNEKGERWEKVQQRIRYVDSFNTDLRRVQTLEYTFPVPDTGQLNG